MEVQLQQGMLTVLFISITQKF